LEREKYHVQFVLEEVGENGRPDGDISIMTKRRGGEKAWCGESVRRLGLHLCNSVLVRTKAEGSWGKSQKRKGRTGKGGEREQEYVVHEGKSGEFKDGYICLPEKKRNWRITGEHCW